MGDRKEKEDDQILTFSGVEKDETDSRLQSSLMPPLLGGQRMCAPNNSPPTGAIVAITFSYHCLQYEEQRKDSNKDVIGPSRL